MATDLKDSDLEQMMKLGRIAGATLNGNAFEEAAQFLALADTQFEHSRLRFWLEEGVRNSTYTTRDTTMVLKIISERAWDLTHN